MNVKENKDFLDVLRLLSDENINQLPKLKDSFFQSLMMCSDDTEDYIEGLSDSYFKTFEKQYAEYDYKDIRPVRKLKISNFKIVYTTDKCHV